MSPPTNKFNKNVLLFCGDNSDSSKLCIDLIEHFYQMQNSKVREQFNILFISKHTNIEEFNEFKENHESFF